MADDLAALAQSFYDAADRVRHEVEQVGSKGGLNIKTATQEKWKGSSHLPRLWRSVGYDVTWSGDLLRVEVGPDIDQTWNQGPLGGVLEEGTINNAPRPALNPALLAETPRFEKALGDVGEKLADGR